MALAQWISLIIIAILPAIWALAAMLVRIPENQRFCLALYAPMAVAQVEQQHRDQNNEAKKALATAIVAKAFKAARLPLPNASLVESAIEAAVFSLPKTHT
jgi:hypothetical protein